MSNPVLIKTPVFRYRADGTKAQMYVSRFTGRYQYSDIQQKVTEFAKRLAKKNPNLEYSVSMKFEKDGWRGAKWTKATKLVNIANPEEGYDMEQAAKMGDIIGFEIQFDAIA